MIYIHIRLERGPGIIGEIHVYWNITPAVDSEFEETSGVVTMRDGQSAATIRLKVFFLIPVSEEQWSLLPTEAIPVILKPPTGNRSSETILSLGKEFI